MSLVTNLLFLQKREKRRWLFRKPSNVIENNAMVQQRQTQANDIVEERHHAIAVAVATAAAAEAAVASAHAAMEVARLARPSTVPRHYNNYDYAAILIQTAFRGYLVSLSLIRNFANRSASIQFSSLIS